MGDILHSYGSYIIHLERYETLFVYFTRGRNTRITDRYYLFHTKIFFVSKQTRKNKQSDLKRFITKQSLGTSIVNVISQSHLQMERAGGYRHRVDQHIEPVLAHGLRHELGAEHGRAGRSHRRRHRRAVWTCAPERSAHRHALTPYP